MTFIMNRAVVTGSYAPSMALERKLDAYDRERRALLDEMDALDPILLSFRHRAGEWSILEILEHVALAEQAALLNLREPELPQRYRLAMFTFLRRLRIPVRLPSSGMMSHGAKSLLEVRRLWDENSRTLRACLARLGPGSTVSHAIGTGQLHLAVHRRQIWRILERPPVWEP